MEQNEARVNITWGGQNGDLPDPVQFDAPEDNIRQWITEAVRAGDVPGIPADPNADFSDFIVKKFEPNEGRPHNLIQIRPKTAYGRSA